MIETSIAYKFQLVIAIRRGWSILYDHHCISMFTNYVHELENNWGVQRVFWYVNEGMGSVCVCVLSKHEKSTAHIHYPVYFIAVQYSHSPHLLTTTLLALSLTHSSTHIITVCCHSSVRVIVSLCSQMKNEHLFICPGLYCTPLTYLETVPFSAFVFFCFVFSYKQQVCAIGS